MDAIDSGEPDTLDHFEADSLGWGSLFEPDPDPLLDLDWPKLDEETIRANVESLRRQAEENPHETPPDEDSSVPYDVDL